MANQWISVKCNAKLAISSFALKPSPDRRHDSLALKPVSDSVQAFRFASSPFPDQMVGFASNLQRDC